MTNKDIVFRFAIGRSDEGSFVACSEVEPIFCFICKTEEEAKRVAQETYADYQRRFFKRVVSAVSIERVPVVRVRDSQAYALTEAVA